VNRATSAAEKNPAASSPKKALLRACPVCGNALGEIIHHQAFAVALELKTPEAYDVVCCTRCGFAFADFVVDAVEIDRAYETRSKYAVNLIEDGGYGSSHRSPAPEPPYDLERLRGTAAYLARIVADRNARILDAGCATGALLGFLRAQGFTRVAGLDPSPDAVAVASRVHGASLVVGSFMDPPAELGTFDVVVLSHTLEHLPAVGSAIRRLAERLEPGGLAYVEVPDAARYADYLVAPFHDFNTEHINHFSLSVLRTAMRLGGFEEVEAGEKLVECGPAIPYPAIYGVWRKSAALAAVAEIEPDLTLAAGLRRYVDASATLMARISEALAAELPADRDVAIWGAGQLTMKLVRDTVLARRRVVAIVDGSPQRRGLHIDGVRIFDPEVLRSRPEVPVVVASIHSEDSILRMMREQYALPNRAVLLDRAGSRGRVSSVS
jgi:SAM-dependent methyltransferase